MREKSPLPQIIFIWTLFVSVILAHFFMARYWFEIDFAANFNSCTTFLMAISRAYQQVINGNYLFLDPSVIKATNNLAIGTYWPVAAHLIGLWALIFLPLKLFFLPNVFYLSMIMLAIYRSMRLLIGERFYSMLAAVIFASYWIVAILMRTFEVHLPTAVCIAWGFYWYLRCRFFTKFLESVMMGIFIVLALYCDRLTPCVFLCCLFLVPENFRQKKSLLYMAIVLLFVGIYCWPFYSRWVRLTLSNRSSWEMLFSQETSYTPPLEGYKALFYKPRFFFAHLSYYFISLTERLLGYGSTALLVIGIFFLKKLNKQGARILWIAILVPLFSFILILKKDYIYIFPLCIYFAMVSSMGIFFMRKAYVRYALICMIVVLFAWQSSCFLTPFPSTSLLSKQFNRIRKEGVPKLHLLLPIITSRENILKQAALISKEIAPFLGAASFSGDSPNVIVRGNDFDNRVIFLLNYFLPKVNFIPSSYFPQDFLANLSKDNSYALLHRTMIKPSAMSMADFDLGRWQHILENDSVASNRVIRMKLASRGIGLAQANAYHLVDVFNEILGMRDFHSLIKADALKSSLSKEAQAILVRAQNRDGTLTGEDYARLNRALLEASYPQKIWRDRSGENGEICVRGHCWNNVKLVFSSEDGITFLYHL